MVCLFITYGIRNQQYSNHLIIITYYYRITTTTMYSSENLENKQQSSLNNDTTGDNNKDEAKLAARARKTELQGERRQKQIKEPDDSNKFPQKLFELLQTEDVSIVSWTIRGMHLWYRIMIGSLVIYCQGTLSRPR